MKRESVTVHGRFGDSWLHELFPRNVGPSPAPYSFDCCELVEIFEDGSAKVETVSIDYRRRERIRYGVYKSVKYCKRREAIVPDGYWTYGGRGIYQREGAN